MRINMQVMGSFHNLLPNLQTLEGWVSIPEEFHWRQVSLSNPLFINDASVTPILSTTYLRAIPATVQAPVQATVQAPVQATGPAPFQVPVSAQHTVKAMAGARKSFPKKPGRLQSDSSLKGSTFNDWPRADKRPSEQDMPTGMSRRWKKVKGTPAESHPSV